MSLNERKSLNLFSLITTWSRYWSFHARSIVDYLCLLTHLIKLFSISHLDGQHYSEHTAIKLLLRTSPAFSQAPRSKLSRTKYLKSGAFPDSYSSDSQGSLIPRPPVFQRPRLMVTTSQTFREGHPEDQEPTIQPYWVLPIIKKKGSLGGSVRNYTGLNVNHFCIGLTYVSQDKWIL